MKTSRFIHKQTALLNKQAKLKSKQPKKFVVVFTRKTTKNGKFKTKFRVRRIESSVEKERGILHKVVGLKGRFVGDKPSLSKKIDSFKPTTTKGKFGKKAIKLTYSGTKKVANLTIQAGLAFESARITVSDVAGRAAMNTIKQKYSSAAVDDASRGVIAGIGVARATFVGAKTIRQHKKLKNQYKLEKVDYKLKKHEYKGQRKDKITQCLKDNKTSLSRLKSHNERFFNSYKSQLKTAKKSGNKKHVSRVRLKTAKRKKLFKSESKLMKVQRSKLKFEKKSTKKLIKSQHKIAKLSNPGFIAFKPFKFGGKKLAASAWQKAVNADNSNDFMIAANKIKQISSTVRRTKAQRLQKQRKKHRKLQKNQAKKNQKLQKNESKLKAKAKKAKIHKKPASTKARFSDAIKKFFGSSKNVYVKEAKRLIVAFLVPVAASLLIFVMTLEIISGIFSNGTFVLGTYNAQDYDLTQAVEMYTELAQNMNDSIVKIQTDWKNGLAELGVDTSEMDEEPTNYVWGRSHKFNYDPVYDFDRNKLWSFLCAYYYDFSVDNGDVVYWEYKDDTDTLIQELFEKEYKFESLYEDTSHWEDLSNYRYISTGNGGLTINGNYYVVIPTTDLSVISEGGEKYIMFKLRGSIPDGLSDYHNNKYFYMKLSDGMIYKYKLSSGRIVMEPTYWYFQDQRYSVQTTNLPYFYKSNGSYCHNSISSKSWVHITDDLYSEKGLTENQIWLISRRDTLLYYDCEYDYVESRFNYSKDYKSNIGENKYACLARLYQTKEWVEECYLYYNVKRMKTFDEVIKEKLMGMADGTERYNYYLLLIGDEQETGELFGNHQTLYSMFESSSFRDYAVLNRYGYDVQVWNSTHCAIENELHLGIDIQYGAGKKLFAPLDNCRIESVDTGQNKIVLRINNVNYWYEDNSTGKNLDTKITIYNAKLVSGLSVGSVLFKGQQFATVTNSKKCSDDCVNSSLSNFVHVESEIETLFSWNKIDPELLLY